MVSASFKHGITTEAVTCPADAVERSADISETSIIDESHPTRGYYRIPLSTSKELSDMLTEITEHPARDASCSVLQRSAENPITFPQAVEALLR